MDITAAITANVNLLARLIAELVNSGVLPANSAQKIIKDTIAAEADPNARQEIQNMLRQLFPGQNI